MLTKARNGISNLGGTGRNSVSNATVCQANWSCCMLEVISAAARALVTGDIIFSEQVHCLPAASHGDNSAILQGFLDEAPVGLTLLTLQFCFCLFHIAGERELIRREGGVDG